MPASTPVPAREQKLEEKTREDPDSDQEKEKGWLSMTMSELSNKHFKEERERKLKAELESAKNPSVFDTPPSSEAKDLDYATMPDHPIKMKAPPNNIADDPYGVNNPWIRKDSQPVIDRGEIWYLVDNVKRREAGRQAWEKAKQVDPSAKAENLYPEAPDFLAMPRSEYWEGKADELFKHRDARRFELIKDQDILDAIQAGPERVDQLRDLEHRWVLDQEGVPPKRPIITEDLDILYDDYVKLLGAPGHKFPGCRLCENAYSYGKFGWQTIKKKTREGGEHEEAWHFRDNHESKPAERACKKFLRALVGFELQKKKAAIHAPLIAENLAREQAGKKAIPLNESRVDKFIREIEEDARAAPSTGPDSEPESEEEAAVRIAKELKASQEHMTRIRAEEDVERLKAAWQRYATQERFLKLQGQSAADALELPNALFSTYFPSGLPYNGKLVYNKADIKAEDWERFKNDRAEFEKEEGKKLQGMEKQQWYGYIGRILEEFKPPRSLLTEEPKAT